jgi:glycosyltransferase involved in cell wall biosynthesis
MSLSEMENVTTMDTPDETDTRRPVVLVLMEYYLPGYKSGGPLRAISGLTEALGDEFDFMIITTDRDFGDREPYEGIRRNEWMRVGKAGVLYVDRRNPFALLRHILKTPHDVLYMKSFCSRPFSIWPCWMRELGILRTRSIVLAPCGEFAPGALALKKFKKRIYIAIARRLSVYKRAVWHVTSLYEAADVKRELGHAVKTVTARSIGSRNEAVLRAPGDGLRMVVASELRAAGPGPSEGTGRAKVPGELRAIFLARVARNKNIAGAVNSLYGLVGNVTLDIYGPLEDKRYWAECQQTIAGLPKDVQVQYRGSVPHSEVHRVLASYHLLFFPTMGENFGYAISEALQAGCPILISDRTPWRNLEAAGVGWDLPLDQPERFREVLQRCIDMGSEEYDEFTARALAYGWLHSQNPEIVSQNRKLFETALT